MSWLLWIIAIVALLFALKNHFKSKSLLEEIDDLRNSYIDLRKEIKETREISNENYSKLAVELLKSQNKLSAKKLPPYRITEDCITCGSCVPECPVENCIIPGEPYKIIISKCIGCGKCAKVCPVDSCVPIESVEL